MVFISSILDCGKPIGESVDMLMTQRLLISELSRQDEPNRIDACRKLCRMMVTTFHQIDQYITRLWRGELIMRDAINSLRRASGKLVGRETAACMLAPCQIKKLDTGFADAKVEQWGWFA
jgi:hypothetical protein